MKLIDSHSLLTSISIIEMEVSGIGAEGAEGAATALVEEPVAARPPAPPGMGDGAGARGGEAVGRPGAGDIPSSGDVEDKGTDSSFQGTAGDGSDSPAAAVAELFVTARQQAVIDGQDDEYWDDDDDYYDGGYEDAAEAMYYDVGASAQPNQDFTKQLASAAATATASRPTHARAATATVAKSAGAAREAQSGTGSGASTTAVREKDSGAGASGMAAPGTGARAAYRSQPAKHAFAKYEAKINLGMLGDGGGRGGGGGPGRRVGAHNDMKRIARDDGAKASRHTGRDDRATTEQVMDPRTRLILFKLLNSGFIQEINGCISTGKEANVYYAVRPDGAGVAVKIFKTSILVFKDRDRYVSGEHRFRTGYSRSNPRKMVRVWAEKEMRNLKRLNTAGIPCPEPLLVRANVLAMDFVGRDGWPAPRLKDASLSSGQVSSAYSQVVDIMRRMFQVCRLVHADLSEYNMLWQKGRIVVIDVSQSVESDHPRAMDFLRMDCQNVTDFFARKKLATMLPRELFDFVTHTNLATRADEEAYLAEMSARAKVRPKRATAEDEVSHAVFMQSYIPRSLADIRDHELEGDKMAAGETDGVMYEALSSMLPTGGAASGGAGGADGDGHGADAPTPTGAGDAEMADGDGDAADDAAASGSGEEEGDRDAPGAAAFTRKGKTQEERKAHKAAVRAAAAERRKHKLPKSVKKGKMKANKKKR